MAHAVAVRLRLESSEGSTGLNTQDGTCMGLAVDAGCHLGGQLLTRVPKWDLDCEI